MESRQLGPSISSETLQTARLQRLIAGMDQRDSPQLPEEHCSLRTARSHRWRTHSFSHALFGRSTS